MRAKKFLIDDRWGKFEKKKMLGIARLQFADNMAYFQVITGSS